MTYNVFGGMLSLTQSINQSLIFAWLWWRFLLRAIFTSIVWLWEFTITV